MRRTTLVLLALAVPLACAAAACRAQVPDGYIDLQIVNPSPVVRRTAVYDNVCDELVLDKPVDGNGAIPVQVCARGMGRGDVTVRNIDTGAEQRHEDVFGGTQIEVP